MKSKTRLAFIVSHPIQYYVPLYQRLAAGGDVEIKVFYTWHAATQGIRDHGFGKVIAWDIPLTSGYDFAQVENTSRNPGTHHFWGLRNPALVTEVLAWRPDFVHVTGWAWFSHLQALFELHQRGIQTLFRGDSHLLDRPSRGGVTWQIKRLILRKVFSWPAEFLYVGKANRAYYETFGVKDDRLHYCPHSIDVDRFTDPSGQYLAEAQQWRNALGIGNRLVVLFVGKFEQKKRPVELMEAFSKLNNGATLLLVGDGVLRGPIEEAARARPDRFRVLPFQNQSRMPVVYRMGDLLVLPSSHAETWGLAVNEAFASGLPAIVSDRVGCAQDVITPEVGTVFPARDWARLTKDLAELTSNSDTLKLMGKAASARARKFDISRTVDTLMESIQKLSTR